MCTQKAKAKTGPRPVNTNSGLGLVNANWGPGPGPGLKAKQRAGGQEIQTPFENIDSAVFFTKIKLTSKNSLS